MDLLAEVCTYLDTSGTVPIFDTVLNLVTQYNVDLSIEEHALLREIVYTKSRKQIATYSDALIVIRRQLNELDHKSSLFRKRTAFETARYGYFNHMENYNRGVMRTFLRYCDSHNLLNKLDSRQIIILMMKKLIHHKSNELECGKTINLNTIMKKVAINNQLNMVSKHIDSCLILKKMLECAQYNSFNSFIELKKPNYFKLFQNSHALDVRSKKLRLKLLFNSTRKLDLYYENKCRRTQLIGLDVAISAELLNQIKSLQQATITAKQTFAFEMLSNKRSQVVNAESTRVKNFSPVTIAPAVIKHMRDRCTALNVKSNKARITTTYQKSRSIARVQNNYRNMQCSLANELIRKNSVKSLLKYMMLLTQSLSKTMDPLLSKTESERKKVFNRSILNYLITNSKLLTRLESSRINESGWYLKTSTEKLLNLKLSEFQSLSNASRGYHQRSSNEIAEACVHVLFDIFKDYNLYELRANEAHKKVAFEGILDPKYRDIQELSSKSELMSKTLTMNKVLSRCHQNQHAQPSLKLKSISSKLLQKMLNPNIHEYKAISDEHILALLKVWFESYYMLMQMQREANYLTLKTSPAHNVLKQADKTITYIKHLKLKSLEMRETSRKTLKTSFTQKLLNKCLHTRYQLQTISSKVNHQVRSNTESKLINHFLEYNVRININESNEVDQNESSAVINILGASLNDSI